MWFFFLFFLFLFLFFSLTIEFSLQKEKPLIFMKSFENFSSFIFLNLFREICSGDFSFSWRFVHGDLSFEDLFRRFFLFMKMCSWRFVIWRFVQEIFPFEDLFRRFSLFEDLFRRFFLSWRCVYGNFSIEDLFRRFFLLWRCVHGDLSFEDWSVGDLSHFEDLC